MAFNVSLLITPLGANTGPFNVYSNIDNYQSLVAIVTQDQLVSGFSIIVPDNTVTLLISSTGTCGTNLYVNIVGNPPSITPTITPTITPSPTPPVTFSTTPTPSRSRFVITNPKFPSKTPTPSPTRKAIIIGEGTPTGGNGTPTCLVYNTPIIMNDGTIKSIQDIQIGDKILSISNKDKFFTTNKFRKSTANITGVNSILVNNVISINNGLLTTSDSHINVIKRDNIWSLKTSKELLVGDIIIDINKNEIKITSLDILNESQQVYNITVDKEHMYFANNILTHNKQAPPGQLPGL